MNRFNFRIASCNREDNAKKIAALQEDFIKILEKDGVSGVKADPKFQMNAAKLLREVVIDEFSMTDPTPIFTERRTGTLGDKIEFERLINTLRVVKYSPGSHPLAFTPKKAKYTVTTSMFELVWGVPLHQVMTRQRKIEDVVKFAAEALTRHYVKLVLEAVDTACTGNTDIRGRALSTSAAGATVAEAELDAAIRRLQTYGGNITIFGSKWALWPIMALVGATADGLIEEWQRRGQIGFYKGCRLVAIEDDYNEYQGQFTTVNGVDWDKVLFLTAGETGAVLLERDLSALNWEDLDTEKAQFRTGVRFDHGIFVHKPWRYHVIHLV